MRVLLDNTGIHRLGTCLADERLSRPLRPVDALALLHFAEHILFADSMQVSTFEVDYIRDKTEETIQLLEQLDCVEGDGCDALLSRRDFSRPQYAAACDQAAPSIQADLARIDQKTLLAWSKLATWDTQPLGINRSPLERWVRGEVNKHELDELAETSLAEKANGSYDYILATNRALREQFESLTSGVSTKSAFQVAFFLDVFFRLHVNSELGEHAAAVYSPAPQRAITIGKCDELFRYAIEREVESLIAGGAEGFRSVFVEEVLRNEVLPLPMLAIHFLRNQQAGSPIRVLQAAREMRGSRDVRAIRKWLSKWENKYSSSAAEERDIARRQLDSLVEDLAVSREGSTLRCVLRLPLTVGPGGPGEWEITPNLAETGGALLRWMRSFTRPRSFLAALRQEFELERDLGGEVCRLLGRAIVRS